VPVRPSQASPVSHNQPFDDAVQRLVNTIAEAGPPASSEDLAVVVRALRRMLASRWSLSGAEDIDDAIADTLGRFAQAVRSGRIDAAKGSPAAYLATMARHAVFDRLRRAHTEGVHEPLSAGADEVPADDEIARWLSAEADLQAITAAVAAALAARDYRTVEVVARWLDLAQATGERPSSREVARATGLSHTTVNQALKRLTKYLPRPGPQP
jgi:RNA polymerase sigma factor (sigma-70 family)